MTDPAQRPRRRRSVSPLTWRILAVNLFALGVLVAGLLYLGNYRQNLIANELAALEHQARMFAAALGEGAVTTDSNDSSRRQQALVPDAARQMIRRMVDPAGTRARLFDADGVLIVDSRLLFGPGGIVQIEELPPPGEQEGLVGELLGLYDAMIRLIPGFDELPSYKENAIQRATDYPEVDARVERRALQRRAQQRGGLLVLSVAAPVQRYKQVLGALMLSKDSREIDAALYNVRADILRVFGIALTITVLLSIYLAGSIIRPIRRLAAAAESVRLFAQPPRPSFPVSRAVTTRSATSPTS